MGSTVWLDCSQRGAIKFQYVAQRDNGNAKRYNNFFLIRMFRLNANKKPPRLIEKNMIEVISYVIYGHVAYKKLPCGMLVSLKRNKNSVA
ncbi:MAG: hypothetical protein WCP96_15670 [Methylococcaceae bacterium]